MEIWRAIGLVAVAVGAAILLRAASHAIRTWWRRRALRGLRFCPACGVLLADRAPCARCDAAAGNQPSPSN